MAARKTVSKKTSPKKKSPVKKAARKKGKLSPGKSPIGLKAEDMVLSIDDGAVAVLVAEIRAVGGAVIGAYREPLSGRPMLMASLPLKSVQPTPFQRDLSPTHTKRLAEKIKESGSFLDPLVVVRGEEGRLWTPNGRHRLAAAKVLGLQQITAIVSPDEALAFRILALNTEKAHNLKDRSLEVIRMARTLAERKPRSKESDYHAEFEAAELLTLGIIYSENKRFAGGAYSPMLKKVDRFSERGLKVSLREREGYAARLQDIDSQVKKIIEKLQRRGFKSPYLRTYVVARLNPVRFHRAKRGETTPPMSIKAALTRMAAAARNFDVDSVRQGDLAIVAAMAG
ncbi:MAG: ParB N-terminal domain-containing protein [Gammaproteobacteria bacterium]